MNTNAADTPRDSRFRELVDSIRDYAIFLLDCEGRVLTWNPGAHAIKGYDANEIVGRSFTVFYTPEDIAAEKPQSLLRRADREGCIEDEGWRVRKDGTRFWASVVVTALHDANGQLSGFAKVTRDLTQRHRLTGALALQGAVLKTVGEGVLLVRESDGTIILANPAAERVMGFAPGELSGQSVAQFVPGGGWQSDRFPAEVQEQLARSGLVTVDAPRLRKDGTTFWAHVNVSQFTHPEEGRLRVVSFHDITQRHDEEVALRHNNEALDASIRARSMELSRTHEALLMETAQRAHAEKSAARVQRRFARLAESGLIGIAVSHLDGSITEANDAFLRMIKYTADDLASGTINWKQLTPPEHADDNVIAVQNLNERGFAGPWEKEYLRKDGTRVPALVGIATLEEGAFLGFALDISQQKAVENSLRRTEDQLRHAQKMEAIGRLAGGIAHDFNNVLSVILSYAELLYQDVQAGDPMREDLGEIQKAARRAANLTKQLLVFSRQQAIAPRVIDLNEVLAGMDRMLQRVIGEDVSFTVQSSPDLGRIRIDPGHVEQVLMNLVVNARDAMPTGGKLTIETANIDIDTGYASTHAQVKPGRYVMLAITDTGCGMDAATQEKIFEPFFTTKGLGQGTGLGLSTVFGIVQQAGGFVWVYSELSHGTTFKLYLPRVDDVADTAAVAVTPAVRRGTETILLVEDEEQLRRIIGNILRRQGYKVLDASNGGEALLLCESAKDPIDLLLTDVVMPQMSGPVLAKRLVALHPGMKVLCMSGYADDSIIRHGLLDGTFPFIQKPITPDSLSLKLREVLDRPAVTTAA